MTLPAAVIIEKNKMHSKYPFIILATITLSDGTTFRLARNTEDIAFAVPGNEDCVLHLPCNDTAASTDIADISLSQYPCTSQRNASLMTAAGKINTAFEFDGANDYIDVDLTGDDTLKFESGDQDFSVSFWLSSANDVTTELIADCRDATTDGWTIAKLNTNVMFFRLNTFTVSSGALTWDGRWYHITAVCKRGGHMQLYINGVRSGAPTNVSGEAMAIAGNTLRIGALLNGTQKLGGKLDNICIFSKALTQAEIDYLYNSGSGTESVPGIFTAFPFEIDATKQNSQGRVPSVVLRVSNITRYLMPYLEDYEGGVGSAVTITTVNTNAIASDYSELEFTWEVVDTFVSEEWVSFELSTPSPLRMRFPQDRYFADSCRFRYNGGGVDGRECNYTAKTITGATNASPCVITAATHGFVTGDTVYIADIVDAGAGTLEDALNDQSFEITRIDANSFSVAVDTGADAVYASGGTAGYSTCDRTYRACADHDNLTRYGGFWGLRTGGVQIA